MNFRKTAARHPGIRWALGAVEFIIIDAMMIFGIGPAFAAAVSIPLADRTIAIDLGDLPQWIVALVAAGGFWKAWRAERRVADLGVKIDGMLVDRDAAKVKEGEAKATVAAGVSAEERAKGVEVGIAQERASVAAANPAPATASAPSLVPADAPVPVEDDRAARIGERSATAAEELAAATKDIAAKKT